MGTVTDLATYRTRRALGGLATWTEEQFDEFWDESHAFDYPQDARRAAESGRDEVQHWTTGWGALLEEILQPAQLTDWQARVLTSHLGPAPLRILRGTDHGSDDGDAESHRGDAGLPRDGAGQPADRA